MREKERQMDEYDLRKIGCIAVHGYDDTSLHRQQYDFHWLSKIGNDDLSSDR